MDASMFWGWVLFDLEVYVVKLNVFFVCVLLYEQ